MKYLPTYWLHSSVWIGMLNLAAAAKSLQSCPTLCDSRDGSPPGSPVPGILQARTLEWVAIFFSNAWKWKVKVKSFSHVWLFATHGLQPTRLLPPWDFPGKSSGVGCHCLLQLNLAKSNKLYRYTYNLTYNLAQMILYIHPSLCRLQIFLLLIVKL